MSDVKERPVQKSDDAVVERRGKLSRAAEAAKRRFAAHEPSPDFPVTPLQNRMQSGRG